MKLKEIIAVASYDRYFAKFVCPFCGHEENRDVKDPTWFDTFTLPNWFCPKCHKKGEA